MERVSVIWYKPSFIYWCLSSCSYSCDWHQSGSGAMIKSSFTGVWTSPEQDNHRSSNQDTSGSVGLGAAGTAVFLSTTGKHLSLHPPGLLGGKGKVQPDAVFAGCWFFSLPQGQIPQTSKLGTGGCFQPFLTLWWWNDRFLSFLSAPWPDFIWVNIVIYLHHYVVFIFPKMTQRNFRANYYRR